MDDSKKSNFLMRRFYAFFGLMLTLVLAACGGGDGSSPPAGPTTPANLSGYYEGTATIDALNVTDLKVMTDNETLIITSVDNGLLYVATVTSITGNDFSADVRIYVNGDFAGTATVSGTASEGSSISGAFSGSGAYTSGTFSLTYSLVNSRAPYENTIYTLWEEASPPITASLEFPPTDLMYVNLQATTSSALDACDVNNAPLVDVQTEQPGRILSFSGSYASCTDSGIDGTAVQGFMTSFDGTSADNKLLFVIYDDNHAHIAVLDRILG